MATDEKLTHIKLLEGSSKSRRAHFRGELLSRVQTVQESALPFEIDK